VGAKYTTTVFALLALAFIDWKRPAWLGYDTTTKKEGWFRIAFNTLLTGLWIGAIPASFYTCNDLCSAAGDVDSTIHYATLFCECFGSQSVFERFVKRGVEQRTHRYEATETLDILLA